MTVFTLDINPTSGEYTFSQFVELDHADGGNDNDVIALNFPIKITDFDGDSEPGVIKINIKGPDFAPIDIRGVGQTDDTNLTDDGMDMIRGAIEVNFQGDEGGVTAGTGSFTSGGERTADTLSSGGVPITVAFDANTNTYVGTAGNVTVFTMVINSDATYKFTQLEPLDHSNTNSDNESLYLNFGVRATDNDGDTGTGTVRITVLDDGPSIRSVAQRVYEDNIGTNAATITNTIPHDFGEDGAGRIAPNGRAEVRYSTQGPSETLTSGGVAVIISQTANGYIGKAGSETVFTFTIDPATGAYAYTQLAPVDHVEGHPLADDIIWLTLGVDIVDNDGDAEPAYVCLLYTSPSPRDRG